MSTIDWSTAPEWANYQARDKNGSVSWYENEPILQSTDWYCPWTERSERVALMPTWEQSLQKRPTATPKKSVLEKWLERLPW